MLQFEMHGFMYGALMWLGNGDMVLRAPEKISATVRPEGLAPQPKNMGSLMAHAPSAQRVLGENRVRRVEGKMVPVVDFGAAAIDARYFKLVTQTHQGLEWRDQRVESRVRRAQGRRHGDRDADLASVRGERVSLSSEFLAEEIVRIGHLIKYPDREGGLHELSKGKREEVRERFNEYSVELAERILRGEVRRR